MTKKRTGTIVPRGKTGNWRARIRLANGSRPWIDCPEGMSEARARDWAAHIQEREDKDGKILAAKVAAETAKSGGPGETLTQWVVRWFEVRRAKGYATVPEDVGRIKNHVAPVLGHLAMATITRADLEALVRHLDAKVASASGDPKLRFSWKSAWNVWGLVTKMFSDASRSKNLELRVRDDNPADGVEGPERGEQRIKPPLYPDEFAALIACEAVPLRRRRMYAFAVYTAMRAGEVEALTGADVDLEHLQITVSKSVERKTSELTTPKSGRARTVTIEPELLPLLRVLMADAGDDPRARLVRMPPDEDRAELLRADLRKAGVTREALFADDEVTQNVTYHRLRDTGLTWCAVRGDDPLTIMWRAGHADFKTTQRYIAEAARLRSGFGVPFPSLASVHKTDYAHLASQPSARNLSAIAATPMGIEPDIKVSDKSISAVIGTSDPTGNTQPATPNYANTRIAGLESEPWTDDRAALLQLIDDATRRGDVDAASSLLARLLSLPPVADRPRGQRV